jgi:outer membrane protein assembly factor BamA
VTLVRETATRIPITATYRLSSGRTEATAVSFCAFFNVCVASDIAQLRQRRPLATLTLGMQRIRTNYPLDPTRGSTLSAEITTSSTAIGSSSFTEFTRFIGDIAAYQPLRSAVLAGRIRFGTVFAPSLAIGGGTSNFVPPEQRFYAGGPNDVRGYTRNLLGPVVYVVRESALDSLPSGEVSVPEDSVQVAPTGGNSLLVANLELRFPSPVFRDRLRLAVFVDGGSVWQRQGTGPGSRIAFRITPGVGFRFITPLGPVRVDAAYNGQALIPGPLYKVTTSGDLVKVQDDYRRTRITGKGIAIQFSVGQAF